MAESIRITFDKRFGASAANVVAYDRLCVFLAIMCVSGRAIQIQHKMSKTKIFGLFKKQYADLNITAGDLTNTELRLPADIRKCLIPGLLTRRGGLEVYY
jgi:hypothetical protein